MAVSTVPVRFVRRRFGETVRRDLWWVQPLGSRSACRRSSCTRRGRRFRASTTRSARTSRRSTRRSSSAIRRTAGSGRSRLVAGVAAVLAGAADPAGPGGFRTCYYYRGAYYKAFWADPPSCTVGEPRKRYRGENSFPLILQNIHRYFLFISVVVLVDPRRTTCGRRSGSPIRRPGAESFGIGVGTLVLATQRRAARRLHVRLPLAAAPGRRLRRSTLARAARRARVQLRELPQPPAHAVGLDEPVRGGLR